MRIALLGDIALIGRYDKTKTPDVQERVQLVHKLVSDCDFVIANLESPLTSRTRTHACKGVYLRSDPRNVDTLNYLGVTHVTLANNHIYDYGKAGANETIRTLENAGIKYVGLNNDPELMEKGQEKVLLDGFCCLSANALNYGNAQSQVKMLSYETMETFLKFSSSKQAFPIASVHFGLEGLHYPSAEHLNLFRALAKEYTYILHGNHPHSIQGYESCNDSLLIYAQGNLCFDETPVTSIHFTPEEKPEERKCYISILDIRGKEVKDHKAICLTDLETGMIHEDNRINCNLKEYCDILSKPMNIIQKAREAELHQQRDNATKRDFKFYADRLNYKYIGAYLNGRKHAKEYKEVIEVFKEGK